MGFYFVHQKAHIGATRKFQKVTVPLWVFLFLMLLLLCVQWFLHTESYRPLVGFLFCSCKERIRNVGCINYYLVTVPSRGLRILDSTRPRGETCYRPLAGINLNQMASIVHKNYFPLWVFLFCSFPYEIKVKGYGIPEQLPSPFGVFILFIY